MGKGIVVVDDDDADTLNSGVDGWMGSIVSDAAENTEQASLAAIGRGRCRFRRGTGEGSRWAGLSPSAACRDGLALRAFRFNLSFSALGAVFRLASLSSLFLSSASSRAL